MRGHGKDRVIARDRLIGKTGISSRRRGDAEKIGEQNLTADEFGLHGFENRKAITTEDNGGTRRTVVGMHETSAAAKGYNLW
jgi:hypothetical protein